MAVVPGEGRCFYDAVLHQLADCGGPGLYAHADVLTLSMLQALSTCREQFEEILAIDEASQEVQRSQRKMYVLESDAYIPWMDKFTDIDYYVLDMAVHGQCWTLGSMLTLTKCRRGRNLLET